MIKKKKGGNWWFLELIFNLFQKSLNYNYINVLIFGHEKKFFHLPKFQISIKSLTKIYNFYFSRSPAFSTISQRRFVICARICPVFTSRRTPRAFGSAHWTLLSAQKLQESFQNREKFEKTHTVQLPAAQVPLRLLWLQIPAAYKRKKSRDPKTRRNEDQYPFNYSTYY